MRDFLVGIVNLVRTTKLPILWALRFADFLERDISCTNIVQALLLQAIQINPHALATEHHPITVAHLREAVDEVDWLNLLNRALEGVPKLYIVLDGDLLGHATTYDRYLATRWLKNLAKLSQGTIIKIFIASNNIDANYIARIWEPGSWSRFRIDREKQIRDLRRRRRLRLKRS